MVTRFLVKSGLTVVMLISDSLMDLNMVRDGVDSWKVSEKIREFE